MITLSKPLAPHVIDVSKPDVELRLKLEPAQEPLQHKLGRKAKTSLRYERKMGDSELSYFLPSRQAGVNDMYLHIGFSARPECMQQARVRAAWAILRLRHPLLAARAETCDGLWDDVRFVYDAPSSPEAAFRAAEDGLLFRMGSKEDLLEEYLNGPRTLSNTRLSCLFVSEVLIAPEQTPGALREYNLIISAAHFIGDGMSAHMLAHDLFSLLSGAAHEDALLERLKEEWSVRWAGTPRESETILPLALEESMLPSGPMSRLHAITARVDFELSEVRVVGGQIFPRRAAPAAASSLPNQTARQTTYTFEFSPERTRAILTSCKSNRASVNSALFAICAAAWARFNSSGDRVSTFDAGTPTLMYSARSLRPPSATATAKDPDARGGSYFSLALGYFTVGLPSFLPADADVAQAKAFWHRARAARAQCARAAAHPLTASRTREMARSRSERAQAFARMDDAATSLLPHPPPPTADVNLASLLPARGPASSAALLGLSLPGNLDALYARAYPPSPTGDEVEIRPHTLTQGARLRKRGALLMAFTFQGQLRLCLGWDGEAFAEGVVEGFWAEILTCMSEFMG
ncbi:uncharacterized protein BXZ73DRAFT_102912 [Epithele typhae]|uniref:uncharacterized protein n=1 Tax=Epithele typhae TaxID=378194 RepID=UPI002008A994|nr:uncharacterized protein BXZ73DRAFT_102912 [Epithele typhae]KAH9926657.1 hypothetical protein BXZ73DRAFT_102912 [Epithele typhae]